MRFLNQSRRAVKQILGQSKKQFQTLCCHKASLHSVKINELRDKKGRYGDGQAPHQGREAILKVASFIGNQDNP